MRGYFSLSLYLLYIIIYCLFVRCQNQRHNLQTLSWKKWASKIAAKQSLEGKKQMDAGFVDFYGGTTKKIDLSTGDNKKHIILLLLFSLAK